MRRLRSGISEGEVEYARLTELMIESTARADGASFELRITFPETDAIVPRARELVDETRDLIWEPVGEADSDIKADPWYPLLGFARSEADC